MKEIPLTQGKVALVDDADFEWLSQWKWCASKGGNGEIPMFYATRTDYSGGKKKSVRMHRLIMGTDKPIVDHADRNGLNNQRHNLRPCHQGQNSANQSKAHRFDRFKGVQFVGKRIHKWRAQIRKDRKLITLGWFDYSTDAAIAYNEAAKKLFGEFARLNVIPE